MFITGLFFLHEQISASLPCTHRLVSGHPRNLVRWYCLFMHAVYMYVASHHSNSCKTFVGGSAHRPLKRLFNSPKLKFSSAVNLKQRCDNGHGNIFSSEP